MLFIRIGGVSIVRGVVHRVFFPPATGPVERVAERPIEHPVEHGGTATPEELHAHGKLYFVPMGRQRLPAQSLADYYHEKFKLDITVLPQTALKTSSCVPQRKQCVAEEVIQDMQRAYPKIADDPESVMIALTDEDLFARSSPNFTYSLRDGYHAGVVSTRRMDPAFWGEPPNETAGLASTRQMLTKYIAMLYFHLPVSYDPTSILYQPLTPDGGPDDIYESDIYSEASANGLRGRGWPCLSFRYSYTTGKVEAAEPGWLDCAAIEDTTPKNEEIFEVGFGRGQFVDKSLDIQLDSTPRIELRRAYLSDYLRPQAFGLGASHNYNSYLTSDGVNKLTYIEVVREDATRLHLDRISPGIGLTRDATYEDLYDEREAYGAIMTWEGSLLKLQYRNGSRSTFLSCGDATCFWTAYQDAQGNALRFDRDEKRSLHSLTSSNNQKLDFDLDSQRRITRIKASNGKSLYYSYDEAGRLVQVTRADGRITTYSYDSRNRMTQVEVARTLNHAPQRLITNEYDSYGRVVKATVADVGVYQFRYLSWVGNRTGEVSMTDPTGRVWNISLTDEDYTARTLPIRFPAKDVSMRAQR
ncbi:MAG TPA: DUF6531 domain-containing protein [Candidatus Angelobacter sp.]